MNVNGNHVFERDVRTTSQTCLIEVLDATLILETRSTRASPNRSFVISKAWSFVPTKRTR